MKKKLYCLTKRGKVFYVRWWYHGHCCEKSTRQTARYLAEKRAWEIVKEYTHKKIYFRDYAKNFFKPGSQYLVEKKEDGNPISPAVAQMCSGHLNNYLLARFGDFELEDISPMILRKFLRTLELSNSTKNHIIGTMRTILRFAKYEEKAFSEKAFPEFRRLAPEPKQRDALTFADIRRLFPDDETELLKIWEHLKYAVMFNVMLTSGIRRGEVIALQWQHIVWEKSGLLVLQAIKGDGKTIGLPKSNDTRAVILPDRTLELLQLWHDQTFYSDPEHFIFYGERGDKPMFPTTVSKRFTVGLRNSGIDTMGRNISCHSLRHTYNTRLEGVLPGEILRYMIGHRKASMTAHYLHKTPEDRLLDYAESKKSIDLAWNEENL